MKKHVEAENEEENEEGSKKASEKLSDGDVNTIDEINDKCSEFY